MGHRGVTFADYDLPGLKDGAARLRAWLGEGGGFEDPDGNVLCVHEPLPEGSSKP